MDITTSPALHFEQEKTEHEEGHQNMYTATMIYPVKQDSIEDFTKLWEEKILNLAINQAGFVRMQLLTREKEVMAIGTWTEKSHAEAFMSLGSFKELMAAVKDMLSAEPKPTIWNLSAYASR